MESTGFHVNTDNRIVNPIAIYRPPDSDVLEFCNKISNLLENHINSHDELLLLGYFNFTINKLFDMESATFLDILDSFNMVSIVVTPAHQLPTLLTLSSMMQTQILFPK